MNRWIKAGYWVPLMLVSTACGLPNGPHVRVATANAAELEAVHDKDNVWYEFQPGDVVPVELGFLGAFEGRSESPVVFRAKRHFWFVMTKNKPMSLSFDGRTAARPESSQSVIMVMPRKNGPGAQIGWLLYMGESGDPVKELDALVEGKKASGATNPGGAAGAK